MKTGARFHSETGLWTGTLTHLRNPEQESQNPSRPMVRPVRFRDGTGRAENFFQSGRTGRKKFSSGRTGRAFVFFTMGRAGRAEKKIFRAGRAEAKIFRAGRAGPKNFWAGWAGPLF